MKHPILRCAIAALTLITSSVLSAQVFITELADPQNSSTAGRFVELYNAGSSSVDLSTWALRRWTNANTGPQADVALTGTIAAGGFYIITNNAGFFSATYGFAADQSIGTGGAADSNGDDNIALVDGTGTIVDIFGLPGEDGSGTCHEFEDGRAERAAFVTAGLATWNEAEWNVWADSPVSGCTNHTNAFQDAPGIFDPGAWIGAAAGGCGISVSTASAVCDSITADSDDTYTVSIPYTGVEAAVTVVNNSASGVIGGDDPAVVSDGTILVSGISENDAYSITFSAPCDLFTLSGSAPDCDPFIPPTLLFNEIHADPDATGGDANGDGVVSSLEDEFVEIVNIDVVDQDISGYELHDGFGLRHIFPAGSVVPAGCAIVVFGGGTAVGGFGGAVVQVDTAAFGLGLNNSSDNITLFDLGGDIVSQVSYTNGGNNQSINLDPDLTGTSYIDHSTATGAAGALFSPGTLVDGNNFSGCTPPACNVAFQPESVVCVTASSGNTDTYNLSIPYIGVQAGVTITNNTGSGTIGGDDPATVSDGVITISGINETDDYNVALSAPCESVVLTGTAPACDFSYTLVINEVDYDQPGSDDTEFIELKNVGADTIDVAGVQIELVNGSTTQGYFTITLPSATLYPGDYFVVCRDSLSTPNCDYEVSNLAMQNGAPDGLRLNDPFGNLIDAVSYEGDVTGVVEGSGAGLEDPGATGSEFISIGRFPDGVDTDQNNVDFSASCFTPGEANSSDTTDCLCTPPTVQVTPFRIDSANWSITVVVQDLGSATSVNITDDQFVAFEFGVGLGAYSLAPYASGTPVTLTIAHDAFTECDVVVVVDESQINPCPSDINADGAIDVTDFIILNSDFGKTCPTE